MSSLLTRVSRYVAGGAVVAALVASCTSQDPNAANDNGSVPVSQYCATPNEGCPCQGPTGVEVECGKVEQRSGDQVSCSMGKRMCVGGKWGPCLGSHIVVKTVPPAKVVGVSTQAVTQGPCPPPPSPLSNVCDPYCNQVIDDSPILIPGGVSGACQYYEPADPTASYASLPASHQRLPAACAAGTSEECGHGFYCAPPGGGACQPFLAGEAHPTATGNCAGAFELSFATPCDDSGTDTFVICNRGGAPANVGTLRGLVYRESLVGMPTDVSLHKPPTNAIIRGTCTLDLAANAILTGTCVSIARDTLCPGADWTTGGTVSTIQWNMPDWSGVAPDPARIPGECMDKNNYTVYDLGNLLACQGVGCGSASGVTLNSTGNGDSACGAPSDNLHFGVESGGTPCDAVNQYSKCQQDYRCDIPTGQCLWNGGSGWFDSAVAGVDLTVGAACESPEQVPVCNRGSGTVPPGTPINLHFPGPAPAPDPCIVPGGPPDCTFPAPASGLGPGKCMNVPCTIPGNKFAIVSGVVEPPGLCANNQAFTKTSGTPGCATCAQCDTRVSGKVYDPSGATPTDPVATANNVPLAGVTVLQPAGALVDFNSGALGPGVKCDTCAGLDSPYIASTATDATGSFTLSGVTPGPSTRIVVQSGRWRREITMPVTACANNAPAAGTFRMPRNRTDSPTGTADIPKIAVVAGGAFCDSLACMLLRMGISTSEIAPRTGPAQLERIQYWRHATGSLNTATSAPLQSTGGLFTQPILDEYAAVLYSCYCASSDQFDNTRRTVLLDYVNKGGRYFSDHWPGNHTLNYGGTFPNTATWTLNDGTDNRPSPGFVPPGAVGSPLALFRNWLPNANVLPANWVDVAEPRNQASAPIAGTTEWIRGRSNDVWGAGAPPGNPTNPSDYTLSYSFETAFGGNCGAPGGTGRVIFNGMHTSGSRASLAPSTFPGKCNSAQTLTDEERALEYQIFQLTACQLGGAPPPPPPPPLAATEVYRDYEGICPAGTAPEWGFLFWQSVTPPGTNVVFRAATAPDQASLPPSPPAPAPTTVSAGTATGATVAAPSWASDANTVAWHLANDPPGPAQTSKQWIRIYMKLNPIGAVSPQITQLRQDYSCKPAE